MARKLAVLAACAAVACVLAQQPTSPPQPAAVQLQRAIYAQSTAGDLDSAIQQYRAIIASNPSQSAVAAQAQDRLAQALVQKGDLAAGAQQSESPATAKPPKTAVMEGKVISQTTGTPLKKAALKLFPNAMGGTGRAVTTETDDEGKFSFPRVEAGIYSLTGERAGYALQYYGAHSGGGYGAPIPVKEGEELKNIVFKLVPNALLSGRVLDEDGDPVSRATVMVLRPAYRTSGKQLQSLTNATTGANGEFSASVPPGRYYLVTAPGNSFVVSMTAQSAKPPGDAPELAYGPMFYPNSPDELTANAIDAAAGGDLGGLDIHIAKVKTYRVRGQVTESSPKTGTLQLVPKVVSAASSLTP